jgi:hypothetical protein
MSSPPIGRRRSGVKHQVRIPCPHDAYQVALPDGDIIFDSKGDRSASSFKAILISRLRRDSPISAVRNELGIQSLGSEGNTRWWQ